MKPEPTTGPWEAKGANVFAGRDCIAICDTDNAPVETMEANARLMAAAHSLLGIVQRLAGDDITPDIRVSPASMQLIADAHAAIAKAGAA